ncbi:MAG TPA: RsmD family RNA methyltransferase [Saprospiraceae bacterium]|nr:RsmD family RNA methyltransferase [Saprospiraceae bacterium]
MRIIGGQWKGRKINIPSKNWPVRPTTDFAREALFNILDNRLDYEHISALDLFGGTGIHSVELASRGCMDITYVDRYKESTRFMIRLAKEWPMPITVVQSDVIKFLEKASRHWDYIFADPPYEMKGIEEFPAFVLKANVIAPNGFFVLEHASQVNFSSVSGFTEVRHYGQSAFSFFKPGL